MRSVVQRVNSASVAIGSQVIGQINRGVLALVGVGTDDDESDARWMADKIVDLRIFHDEHGKMNRSLIEAGGSALVVSQFTLHGDARKGRRPSFVHAASGETAERLYESVAQNIAMRGVHVATGSFGATMQVALVNDGPVTILLDSKRVF
ncbi:MAG: D-aminoacyl-tRNA deacylase [Actinomycetota bacterium]|nr:D-aminoacyl-tRNA deacylase [Actinomycetota bacterium]